MSDAPLPPARGVASRMPEVLAPAGDEQALVAALAAGADAVYFGLAEGFNARARAGNFALATLAETVARVHRAGARAYLALNTLVFEGELDFVADVVARAAASGVDALIVQDPAVALLAREIAPALEVHASTQMTISSPEAAEFARALGVTRVVVPRELSVAEIGRFAAGTDLELEVFVHGALCVSWSGQCLTSSAWSGRSANRGECAQSCRLPYDLVLDDRVKDLGDVKYLLSPKDLAGLRAVEALAEIGVHGLKIEGRQKSAPYVATTTATYRRWVDALRDGAAPEDVARAQEDLLAASLAYTRGFGDGFLGGSDHQSLVEGRFPKHRGVCLGRVARVEPGRVLVEREDGRAWTGALAADGPRAAPCGTPSAALHGFGGSDAASDGPKAAELAPRPGMGVVFDAGRPEDKEEPGGPLFRVDASANGWWLGFGVPGPDLARVAPGQRVWVTGDPAVARAVERTLAGPEPAGRIAVDLVLTGRAGEPLAVEARARHARATATSQVALTRATGTGMGDALVREKLAAFGGTPFRVGTLDLAGLEPGLHLPVSELKTLRRALVAALQPQVERGPRGPRIPVAEGAPGAAVTALRHRARERQGGRRVPPGPPRLLALCRTDEQLEAVIAAGLSEVELDWMELVGLARAVARARAAGLSVTLATVRVQKPGEEGYDRRLAALAPDAVLARHWGALADFRRLGLAGAKTAGGPALHGDFSLNVTNSVTAAELFARGLATLTPSHDLDRTQLLALLDASDPARFTVVLHHRMPTFHTEHCVYSHLLSEGRDFRTCGRPCERHRVALKDARGREHPVIVDVACRNTVFDGEAQSAALLVPELLARGVRRFRVELVRESGARTRALLTDYALLLAGTLAPQAALERAEATSRVGVAPEAMAVMR